MSKFQELQTRHLELVARYEQDKSSKALLEYVQAYVEQVRLAGKEIGDSRERNQLRANLRFWGAYIYDHTGTYPNLNLLPSEGITETPPSNPTAMNARGIIIASLVLLAAVFLVGLLRPIRPYSQQPSVTNTPINPDSLFSTPIPITGATELPDVEIFATGTAMALTPLPVPAIGLIRINFPAGSNTITLSGTLEAQNKIRYVLAAVQGQTLNLKLTGPANELALSIYAPNGTALKAQDTTATWSRMIPFNGDYLIEVVGVTATSNKTYTLEVGLITTQATGFVPGLIYSVPKCSEREIAIAWRDFDWDKGLLPSLSKIEYPLAYLSLLGSGEIVSEVNLVPNADPTKIPLGNSKSDQSYFLQIKHSTFLFQPIIIQFTSDCVYNNLSITYSGLSNIIDKSTLNIDLALVDWGPDSPPSSSNSWIAKLLIIQAQGGIYMYNSGSPSEVIEKTFFVKGVGCSSVPLKISRASNGKYQEVLLSLFLAGPLCPK